MKQSSPSGRWRLVVLLSAAVAATALASLAPWLRWSRLQICDQTVREIESLPEPRALAVVRGFSRQDPGAPAVLVRLFADRREGVALAAQQALDELISDWGKLPVGESSPRVAGLARELAAIAPGFPARQQQAARELAARLVAWDLDPRATNAGQAIADCESVLRLSPPADDDVRLAAAIPRPPNAASDPPPAAIEEQKLPPIAERSAPVELPPVEAAPLIVRPAQIVPVAPPVEAPIYGQPREPERLIDASRERPEEPRQLRRPKAMKIEG